MNKVQVSVVMAVHNSDIAFLKQSVDSILNQTYQNFELIIIDDINSYEVTNYLIELQNCHRNVILLRNKTNIGLTKSLIMGIESSKGVYVARQDADDISEPDRLNCQLKYLKANPETVLLGTSYRLLYGDKFLLDQIQLINHKEIIESFLVTNPFAHTSVIFDKDIYGKIGGYNKSCRYSQDFDLWPKFARYGKLSNLPEILVSRRVNTSSVSMKFHTNLYQSIIGIKVRLRERKLFNRKFIIIKIILLGIKQHLSFYVDKFRLLGK